jgi:hypothetical protein
MNKVSLKSKIHLLKILYKPLLTIHIPTPAIHTPTPAIHIPTPAIHMPIHAIHTVNQNCVGFCTFHMYIAQYTNE